MLSFSVAAIQGKCYNYGSFTSLKISSSFFFFFLRCSIKEVKFGCVFFFPFFLSNDLPICYSHVFNIFLSLLLCLLHFNLSLYTLNLSPSSWFFSIFNNGWFWFKWYNSESNNLWTFQIVLRENLNEEKHPFLHLW